MKIVFRDARLAAVRSTRAGSLGLPPEVVQSVQRKLHLVEQAPDERTLRNWKSLHYEKLSGDREGQRSVRVNDKWRVVFVLDVSTTPPTVEIISIDNHYQ